MAAGIWGLCLHKCICLLGIYKMQSLPIKIISWEYYFHNFNISIIYSYKKLQQWLHTISVIEINAKEQLLKIVQ